jgi:hypothetical protein
LNILLTGATGQLGNAIADFLSNQGFSIRTMGRKQTKIDFDNYAWTLGMYPDPNAFLNIDYIIHLAWVTNERGNQSSHLNIGGSAKVFEAARLAGIKVINISSLSAVNPISIYGATKLSVEKMNSDGINLRIAKVEFLNTSLEFGFFRRIIRSLIFVPIPPEVRVFVAEIDDVFVEILTILSSNFVPKTYSLPNEPYDLNNYLKKYYGLNSFLVPRKLLDVFFMLCKKSHTRLGELVHDRWISLITTCSAIEK